MSSILNVDYKANLIDASLALDYCTDVCCTYNHTFHRYVFYVVVCNKDGMHAQDILGYARTYMQAKKVAAKVAHLRNGDYM